MAEVISETERLILRTWDSEDRAEFQRRLNTPAVMRWLGGVQSEADAHAAFDRVDQYQREFGHTFWIVEDKASGELLGFCGLKRVNSPGAGALTGEAEIGWRLRESAWGKGIAKEAAIASLDLAFGRYDAPHVIALTVQGNSGSWGLMERLGMTRRPDLDFEDNRFGPELNPTIVYRIGKEEWPAARAAALASSPAAQ